ncbi:MAG: hypothetical protein LBH14_04050 [Desulfobulbaceae bacterium]|jgi:hypothetical protein|nr:hypothetical protein [Desulfobulbaceae bacterium]
MRDDRTPNLDLPLPHPDNYLDQDVPRLREALQKVDSSVASKTELQKVVASADSALTDEAVARKAAIVTEGNNRVVGDKENADAITAEANQRVAGDKENADALAALGSALAAMLIPGMIMPFSGTFSEAMAPPQGGTAAQFPINRITGKPDFRFGICTGATMTAPDGTQMTTPDLRGQFIMGVGPGAGAGIFGGVQPGTTGGATTLTLTTSSGGDHAHTNAATGSAGDHAHSNQATAAAGYHSHGDYVYPTTLDSSQMPSHWHNYHIGWGNPTAAAQNYVFVDGFNKRITPTIVPPDNSGAGALVVDNPSVTNGTASAGGWSGHYHQVYADGNHQHAVNATYNAGAHTHTNAATGNAGGHSHTINPTPPYYALVYIMYLGG